MRGSDNVKSYALLLSLAARADVEPDDDERARCYVRALHALERAVRVEATRRGACRDRDASSAVRVRPWSMA